MRLIKKSIIVIHKTVPPFLDFKHVQHVPLLVPHGQQFLVEVVNELAQRAHAVLEACLEGVGVCRRAVANLLSVCLEVELYEVHPLVREGVHVVLNQVVVLAGQAGNQLVDLPPLDQDIKHGAGHVLGVSEPEILHEGGLHEADEGEAVEDDHPADEASEQGLGVEATVAGEDGREVDGVKAVAPRGERTGYRRKRGLRPESRWSAYSATQMQTVKTVWPIK